jgi:hypothetical protein
VLIKNPGQSAALRQLVGTTGTSCSGAGNSPGLNQSNRLALKSLVTPMRQAFLAPDRLQREAVVFY